jgi:hypothetical protein
MFLWQSFSDVPQASTSDPHVAPENDDAHVQVYLFTPSLHVAPFMHGDDRHSLTLSSQLKPL